MEDIKKNVKPISVEEKIKKCYKTLKKVGPVDGGNCAMGAIAIAKFLFEKGIVVQLLFSTPEVDDEEDTIEDKMLDQEIELQHVVISYKDKLFDSTGSTNNNELIAIGKDQYGNTPNFYVYSFSQEDLEHFEKIAVSNTDYSIHWKTFYAKLKESENGLS
jgi:hypothetical protein